jgi:aspartate/methionine/tyrosine aminotransferase
MAITAPLPIVTKPGPLAPGIQAGTSADSLSAPEPLAVSATLAAGEALDARRQRGERVLPMAFGEAGVPVAPILRYALAAASHQNGYGPVAGTEALREAAAGYWTRRGLPTSPDDVVSGPGSKALLYGLLLSLGSSCDVAIPRPGWVSYAAQASLTGVRPVHVPVTAGLGGVPAAGGVPDPERLSAAADAALAEGRRIGAVIVTLPDNPTGTLAGPGIVRALCEVARRHDMLIISDEIYRDLAFAGPAAVTSPASLAPERTVITSGLSKNLALGGWRLGVARLPVASPALASLSSALLAAGSEIWSAPAAPVQQAAALAFEELPDITERIKASRRLHGRIVREVASRFAAAGALVAPPAGGFYLYPDFGPHRAVLAGRYGVRTGADLAGLLLDRYGIGVLPGSAFGDEDEALRMRVATSRLYGDTPSRQEAALASPDPAALPWIASSLDWISESLADLVSPGGTTPLEPPAKPQW